MTIVDIQEYNAFGPWIAEVRTPDDVPRVFRGHDFDPATAAIAIKIPRNIARRDARPGMDLFDQLLIVDDQRLTVLTRAEGAFGTSSVAIAAITAFEDTVDLLDGHLVIHSPTERLELSYNGSSRQQMQHLVDALRQPRADARQADLPREPSEQSAILAGVGQDDMSLSSDFLAIQRREPDARVLAAHGRSVLAPPRGVAASIAHQVRPATLHGAVVFTTAGELHLLHRRVPLARGTKPTLSSAHTTMALGTIRSISARAHETYSGVELVTVDLGSDAIEFPVPAGSATASALLDAA